MSLSSPVPHSRERLLAGRFAVVGRLGSGELTAVCRAVDRQGGVFVAVKWVRPGAPFGAHYLRDEFRARVDIHHPHLLAVRELVEAEGETVLVLEWIDGEPLPVDGSADPADLLRVGEGVVSALQTLHSAGLCHGDVSPHSIWRRPDGSPVLIDVDLAWSTERRSSRSLTPERGRVTYAPASDDAVSSRSALTDFGQLGAALWQACTGRELFPDGADPDDISVADALRDLPDGCPDALIALIGDLLIPGRAVERFAVDERRGELFFGREAELEMLIPRALTEGFSLVEVRGASGQGKSRLVREVLTRAADQAPLRIWHSRCHPWSQVPYRGAHDWVDALGRRLRKRPELLAAPELAPALSALHVLFPRLIDEPPVTVDTTDDEAVGAAAQAFATVVAHIAKQRPLCLWFDDAQWAEPAARRFVEVLAQERPDRVSVWVTQRPEGAPFLDAHVVALDGLDDDAVDAWASYAGRRRPAEVSSPLLLSLVFAAEGDAATAEELIGRTLDRLEPAARALLERVCAANAPIAWTFLAKMGMVSVPAVEQLLGERLVTISAGDDGPALAPAHDAILDAVLASARDMRPHYEALARCAIECNGDVITIADMLTRAESPEARQWWAEAAAEAFRRVAWRHAVRWYGEMERAGIATHATRVRMAHAYTHLGDVRQAVAAWLLVAEQAKSSTEMVEARLAAARIRIGSGDVVSALGIAEDAARFLGMRVPRTLPGVVVQTLWWNLRGALRKLRRLKWREPSERERLRLELGYTMAGVLGSLEGTLGSGHYQRFAVEAEEFGNDLDRARAHGVGVTYLLGGGHPPDKTESIIAEHHRRIDECTTVEQAAILRWGLGYALFFNGDAQRGLPLMEMAAQGFRSVRHFGWEREHAERHVAWLQCYQGRYAAMTQTAQASLRFADRTGNAVSAQQVRAGLVAFAHLVHGNPDACRAEVDDVEEKAGKSAVFGTRYLFYHTRMQLALYEGDTAAVHKGVPAMLRSDFHIRFLMAGRVEAIQWLACAGWLDRDSAVLSHCWRRARRETARWGLALVRALEAAMASMDGKGGVAALYEQAAEAYEELGQGPAALALRAHAEAARGVLPADSLALEALSRRGVADPPRFLRALLPGPATLPL